MPETKQPLRVVGRILYAFGYFAILFGGLEFILETRIPSNVQPFIALISATLLFVSVFIFGKLPDETGKIKAIQIGSFGFGLVQVIFAILFWTVAEPETHFTMWLGIYNRFLVVFGLAFFYAAVFQFFFPSLRPTTPEPPPDPLAEYSQPIQEIINTGRKQINAMPGGILLAALFIGGIGSFIRFFVFDDKSFNFFLVCEGLAVIIAIPFSIIANFKWQKWARQSGIPEAELKAAAKTAKLWWPKIKEE